MRYSRILHLLSSYRTESSTYMPREESFLVSQDLHCWTKLLREEINDAVRGFEKSQDIWGKNKFNYMDLAGKGRNSVHHYNYSHKFVPMKRSQESSSPTSLWRWKQAHVVSSRGTAYLWDKFVWGNLLKRGERDALKCETEKKDAWNPNVVLISELRESRVTYGSEDSGDLSLRDACLGKPRSTNKRYFIPNNVDSRWKGDNGKGMKGGHKEGTQKHKVREVHFVALMDMRHIQKYEYIPENVRESNLKCGHQYKYIQDIFARAISSVEIMKPRWISCTRTSREDRWSGNKGRNFKLGQSFTKWLTVVINEMLREWIQNHPPVQVPSLNIPECLIWVLTNRGLWVMVHHCAKRKNTFANLPSQPWKSTSMVHKIRTTLKRRWIFKRASGNRCLHDAGKTWLPRKAAAAAAAAAAIPCQYIQEQSRITEKERILREDKIGTMIPGWRAWRTHCSSLSSSSMSTSTPW